MREFFEWFDSETINRSKPWLVFGKGPTFSRRHEFDLSLFNTLSLNHAVREHAVDVAHMIDLDVLDACAEVLEKNARVVVLPWFPHIRNRPGKANLAELVQRHSILKRLSEQGRLLWYNLSSAFSHRDQSPIVRVRFFSVEAALNLLALAEVRNIRSLGIDGGKSYAGEFTDLKDKTLLSNGRASFDRQFEEIARTMFATGIEYAPLDIESPMRIYVASTEGEMLAAKILEFSIKKHASVTSNVFPIHLSKIEYSLPKDAKNQPRTPFSFQRFLIPELAGYRGRAIYLDSDMQVFKDIANLWALPFNGASLLSVKESEGSKNPPQFSVMLMNCDVIRWDIRDIVSQLDAGEFSYNELLYDMKIVPDFRQDIEPNWNCLEKFREAETALLHYTNMPTQPWVSPRNPLGFLWVKDLIEAIDVGFVSLEYIQDQVRRGYVRPTLLYQIEHRIEDGLLLPANALKLDSQFIAPYESVQRNTGIVPVHWNAKIRALLRDAYQRSGLLRLERKARNRLG
jgi:Glycosyl transferase family 8